jgi:hypothetical protein
MAFMTADLRRGESSRSSHASIDVVVAAAREHGLRCEEPVVLRDAWHALVHLRPLPVVARVSSDIPFPEGPRPDGVVRELLVAAHAARAGAPVIPPADEVDPGPHLHDGRVVTFWRYVRPEGEVDPEAAGRGLRFIHDTLLDYEDELPPAGHPGETEDMLDSVENSPQAELLRALASRTTQPRGQALHGDAHVFNCLPSTLGPLWHDFETACQGPREYDLAALVLRDRADDGEPKAGHHARRNKGRVPAAFEAPGVGLEPTTFALTARRSAD